MWKPFREEESSLESPQARVLLADHTERLKDFVRKCDKCQRFAHIPRQTSEPLSPVISPWPFAKWGRNLIGPLPTTRAQAKFAIMAIEYFTKCVEAELLSTITEAKCTNVIWRNIICRFKVQHSIITCKGKQFYNAALKEMS